MEDLQELIVHEMYGDQSARVAQVLLRHGALSLSKLTRYAGLSEAEVRNVLVALIQQNLIQVSAADNPQYKLLCDEVLARLRLPKYIEALSKTYGLSEVAEAVLLNGSLTLNEITELCPGTDLTQVSKAIATGFFTQLASSTPEPISEQPLKRKSGSRIQQVLKDRKQEGKKTKQRKKTEVPTEPVPILDGDVAYRLNFKLLDRKLLFELIKGLLESRISGKALKLAEEFSLLASQPIHVSDLAAAAHLPEAEVHSLLRGELACIVRIASENTFSLDLSAQVRLLQQHMTEKLIGQHLGDYAARVFQILRTKGFLDERSLSSLTLLPPITTQAALNDLFRAGLVVTQEVPPDKGLYYGVRFQQIRAFVSRNLLQAIYNLKLRLKEESLSARSLYQSGLKQRYLELETKIESALLELDRTYLVLTWPIE